MLRLQARRASTAEAKEALAEAELRVAAIAVVHESLTTDAAERVDFDAIVDRIISLVRDLAPAYCAGGVPMIARTGSLGSLPAELATPLAMAVSELLHNAVEHAHASRIDVVLARVLEADGPQLRMEVRDDGRGLPEGFDATHNGLGLSIVQSLVAGDLRGDCQLSGTANGTQVIVKVPVPG
jgi:two-component sensor histidine kinase